MKLFGLMFVLLLVSPGVYAHTCLYDDVAAAECDVLVITYRHPDNKEIVSQYVQERLGIIRKLDSNLNRLVVKFPIGSSLPEILDAIKQHQMVKAASYNYISIMEIF